MIYLSVLDAIVGEDDGYVDVVVKLSGQSASAVSVNYTTQEISASDGWDYESVSGTLNFAPGETVKTVRVELLDRTTIESMEHFRFNLSGAVNGAIARASAMISIVGNDRVSTNPLLFVRDVFVDEKAGTATFYVLLGGAHGVSSASTVTVDYAVVGGTATSGSDFTAGADPLTGTLTFAPGEVVKAVTIALVDDNVAEGEERFTLNLSGAVNATIVDGSGVAVIGSSDGAVTVSPGLSVADMVVGEGDGYVDVVVKLSGPSASAVSVNYTTQEISASDGWDYESVSGTLNFAPGETVKTVRVELLDRTTIESMEHFRFNLSGAVNGTIARASAMISIVGNDRVSTNPLLFVRDVVVNEKDGTATFYVLLGGAHGVSSASTVTVDYAVVGGTATSGSDFTAGADPLTGTLTFAPGEVVKAVTIALVDDNVAEGEERFTLNLSGAVNATIVDGSGVAVIGSSDGAVTVSPGLSVADMVVGEGDGYVDVVVKLSDPSASAVSVNYTTQEISASDGWDYESVSGTLNFAPGETVKAVRVDLIDNTAIESMEYFRLNLISAVSATIINSSSLISIYDNDSNNIVFSYGFGDDIYVLNTSNDVVLENINGGSDVVYSSFTYVLPENVEDLMLTGIDAINGTGNSLANRITGNSAANVLSGCAGDDTLIGGAGDDVLIGGTGSNMLDGGPGSDIARYAGLLSQYSVSKVQDEYAVVGLGSNDRLVGIELIEFLDTTLDLSIGVNTPPALNVPSAPTFIDTSADDTFAPASGTLLGSDPDPGASLVYGINGATISSGVSTKIGAYGTLTVSVMTGAWTYTSNNAAIQGLKTNATDSFTVTVSDGSASATQAFTVNITGANDSTAFSGTLGGNVTEDSQLTASGTVNVQDRDAGDGLIVAQTNVLGTYGTFSITADGVWTYVLNNGSATVQALGNGQIELDYCAFATTGGSMDAVEVLVHGMNEPAPNSVPTLIPPTSLAYTDTAGDDAFAPTSGTLQATDPDTDDTLTYGIVGGSFGGSYLSMDDGYSGAGSSGGTIWVRTGSYGILKVYSNGYWDYTPNDSAMEALKTNATDSFTVTVSDGTASASQAFNVTVVGANDPTTFGGTTTGSVSEDGVLTVTGTLTATDRDTGDASIIARSNVVGVYGTFSVDANGAWAYTLKNSAANVQALNTGQAVTDTFAVATAGGPTQNVVITVNGANDAPTLAAPTAPSFSDTAGDDTFTTRTGTLAGSDSDAGAVLTYGISGGTGSSTITKTGTYGTLSVVKSTGAWTYTPNDAAIEGLKSNATDPFTVTVSDGTASATQAFTVNIVGANDPTVFGGTTTGAVTEDGTTTENGSLAVSDRDTGDAAVTAQANTSGTYGTFNISTHGVWNYALNNSAANVQALNAGQTVTDTFAVTTAGGATKNVVITVNGANDAPTLVAPTALSFSDTAGDDTFATRTGTLAGSDPDAGAVLTYGLSSGTGSSTITKTGSYGTLRVVKATGAWTYTPNDAAIEGLKTNGTDEFTVTVSDGSASASQSFHVAIVGADDPTVFGGTTTGSVREDSVLSATGTLTATDRDAGDAAIVAQSNRVGTYGTFSIGANGNWTFALNNSVANVQALNAGQTVTDTFSVATTGGATQNVVISIAGTDDVNTPPTMAAPMAPTFTDTPADDIFIQANGILVGSDSDQGTTLVYDISGTDSDGDSTKIGDYGILTVNPATGAWTYFPNDVAIQGLKSNATDEFTVTVSDGQTSASQPFNVTIIGANDPTVFGGTTTGSVSEDGVLTASGTLNASDRDSGDAVIVAQESTVGVYGLFSIAANGAWNYALNNSAANVQALNTGQAVMDTFAVAAAGGATQNVVISIAGADESTEETPLYSEYFYLLNNPDVAGAVKAGVLISGWQHFILSGWLEGRQFTAPTGYGDFNEDYYLLRNPDVAQVVKAGFLSSGWQHFDLFGRAEGRGYGLPERYGDFSESFYLLNNPDVAGAVQAGVLSSGWQHFKLCGQSEGRSYAPPAGYGDFSETYYLLNNPDVARVVESGNLSSGWQHYDLCGRTEGRSYAEPAGYAAYNEVYYLTNNPDVAAAVRAGIFMTGWQHYSSCGQAEGRSAAGFVLVGQTAQGAQVYLGEDGLLHFGPGESAYAALSEGQTLDTTLGFSAFGGSGGLPIQVTVYGHDDDSASIGLLGVEMASGMI